MYYCLWIIGIGLAAQNKIGALASSGVPSTHTKEQHNGIPQAATIVQKDNSYGKLQMSCGSFRLSGVPVLTTALTILAWAVTGYLVFAVVVGLALLCIVSKKAVSEGEDWGN